MQTDLCSQKIFLEGIHLDVPLCLQSIPHLPRLLQILLQVQGQFLEGGHCLDLTDGLVLGVGQAILEVVEVK